MKKILFLLILLMFSVSYSYAQTEEAEESEEIEEPMEPQQSLVPRKIVKNKKPVPYPRVREDDILWSVTIMRTIDCRERMNFPLYYPTDELPNRKSLIQALMEGIQNKRIQAYDPNSDEMKTKLTPEEVLKNFDAGDVMVRQRKIDGTGDTTFLKKGSISWKEVREFMVKEEWFFDRHRSTMDVRIIGICPIRVFSKNLNTGEDEGDLQGEESKKQLFWVYFPEARRVLANTICFVGKNEQANISFDDIFHKRRFQSYIIGQSDPMNDRRIRSYAKNGVEEILESERIKNDILKLENDFWEY